MKRDTRFDYLLEADQSFGRLGLWMHGHKPVVFMVAIAMLATGAYLATKFRIDNSFDSFFDATDPAFSAYKSYQEEFGSDEVAYLLYSVPASAHGPFDLDAMQSIAQLTEALEYEVPFVKDVTSLSNVEFITAEGLFLEILARPEYRGIDFRWSGDVAMNAAYHEVIKSESATQTLLTLALVSLVAMVCFRMQLVGLLGPLSVVILSMILTVGFMRVAGYTIGVMFLIAPTRLIAIGVAQSVHLIEA